MRTTRDHVSFGIKSSRSHTSQPHAQLYSLHTKLSLH
jgi:hypothetical protein